MSFIDEPGAPPPDVLEPAHYVTFLEHWAAEFPTAPRSRAAADSGTESAAERPKSADPAAGPGFPSPLPPPPPAAEWAPGHGGPIEPGSLRLPRRREATESLRVRLAPEHLYWLRLNAARAGGKVDESVLVAAGLMLLAERAIDWRAMRSRADLRAALAATPPPPPAWTAVAPGEP